MARRKSGGKSSRGDRDRANYLRRRIKGGHALDAEDRDWLAAYEERAAARGRVPEVTAADAAVEAPGEPEAAPAEDPAPEGAPEPEVAPEPAPESDPLPPPPSPPPPPRAGPLPRPPRVTVAPPAGGKGAPSGDWRAKWRAQDGGGSGREETCKLLAGYWVGALEQMAGALREAGIEPVIEPQMLTPAIVLTLDDVLPEHVEITPQMLAVGGSTMILAQRFFRRDEIAKARAKARDRAQQREWREARAADAATPPEPPPPPPPAPEPSPAPVLSIVRDPDVTPPPPPAPPLDLADPSVVY